MSLPEKEIELFWAANTAFVASESDKTVGSGDSMVRKIQRKKIEDALDVFRMAATNLSTTDEELAQSKEILFSALSDAKLLDRVMHSYGERLQALDAAKQTKVGGIYLQKRCYQQQLAQEVAPKLFVSSYHAAGDKDLLSKLRITHILSCINVQPKLRNEVSSEDGKRPLFEFLVIPAEDNDTYDLSAWFSKTFDFIDAGLAGGGGVLVYCGAGISRAPSITAAYLIRKLGCSSSAAIEMIQKVRIVARPNNSFQKQLKAYATRLTAERVAASNAASAAAAAGGSELDD